MKNSNHLKRKKNSINRIKKVLSYFGLVLMLVISTESGAYCQDTTGIQFTEIKPSPTKNNNQPQEPNHKKLSKPEISPNQKGRNDSRSSLLGVFAGGFLWGLTAIFMPCIFPMLPFTVSFFIKKSHSRGAAIRSAMFYGISIIGIYVVLGILVTIIFGPSALNSMSTNGVFNILFFLLLVVFAASFFGAFEINLPSKWVNKTDENSDKGGLLGLFFMAATLSLVSFSCTGPLIGTLLVQAAVSGALLGPASGMFGFSLALALPFTFFAIFPSMLKSLPKSGGWLNSIKVVLGFLELALALKFLSNVDLAYHWHWFDREIFLVLWIVIFALLGFYLLGKLTFSHDSQLTFISVPRLFLAIVVLAFTVYMVPGLWGAPLKSISAFLPPQATQDFDLYTANLSGADQKQAINTDTIKRKYAELFDKPVGQNPFFDYKQAMTYAKTAGKPIMIDFTGHACVNCRKMEANVWTDKLVLPVIRDDYVLVQLYVDDKTSLPANEQYTSRFSGKLVSSIGDLNGDFQATNFNSNSQPYYVLVDSENGSPLIAPTGANYDVQKYFEYLKSGLEVFNRKHKREMK